MIKRIDVITQGWEEYHLIDCGEGRKLEQLGPLVLDRPDPQALWKKIDKNKWVLANAHFAWAKEGDKWKVNKGTPLAWTVSYQGITLGLSFGKFKHIGIFPEHQSQWNDILTLCSPAVKSEAFQEGKMSECRVLNLFGYTGAASLVAAKAGAKVTHVDASKQTIQTVKENIKHSSLPEDAIRLVCEDALKYTKRLVERKEQFEIIVMDPPAFGRGPKGEVWKIEEKLPELLALIPKLLSSSACLVLLNGYAAGYSARTFGELLEDALKDRGGEISYGDVSIKQKNSNRMLTTGIYSKWQNK